MSQLSAPLLINALKKYLNKKLEIKKQNHSKATFTKMIKKEDGKINWHKPAKKIEQMIRAFSPWPGTFTKYNGRRIKILKAHIAPSSEEEVGYFLKTNKGELKIQCEKEALIIDQIQPEGKRVMSGADFVKGYLKTAI